MSAARVGDLEAVRALILSGADLEARDEEGFTAVLLAAHYGYERVLEALLKAGADPNTPTPKGTTPILLAVHGGRLGCIGILLERGAIPTMGTLEGHCPLHEAVAQGEATAVRLLLSAGSDPNRLGASGRSPLHEAARLGNVEMVRALLEKGADPASLSRDHLHWPAWYFAKVRGHGQVLLALRRAGVQVVYKTHTERSRSQFGWRVGHLVQRFLFGRSEVRVIQGIPVRILPKKDRALLFERVREALSLIEVVDPKMMARVSRCLSSIWVPGWHFNYGVFDHGSGACILASNYVLSPEVTPSAIAGTIVHETTHARTWTPEYAWSAFVRARTERLCFEAQRDFLAKAPDARDLLPAIDVAARADPLSQSAEELSRVRANRLAREKVPGWFVRATAGISSLR